MAKKARTDTVESSEQSQPGQYSSGQVVFPRHTSWPIYKGSILPDDSNTRSVLQVDLSHLSTDWLPDLTKGPKLGDTEWEEKRELDTRPPLKRDLTLEKRDFVIQFLKDAKPETLERFFNLAVEEAGALIPEAESASPTPASRPADAPPLWAERTTGREMSPVGWIKMHYGNRDPDNWQAMGLTRKKLGDLDYPLYLAFAKWIKRYPADNFDSPALSRPRATSKEEALQRRLDGERQASQRYRETRTSIR